MGRRLGRFGLWAEFEVRDVRQRMRWIEPGEFWMGSPDDEPERHSDEGPRHRVRITQGFWLADTSCTQALWQAVMGENPSSFKGDPRLPVEQVRWFDTQKFFQGLTALGFPGADLPTEPEWEYACRAGTQTPFHFGRQIDPGLVNYNGNHPYAGGAKGKYRQRTLPVKSFPANDWGLYQMHGNVWEWCKDGPRDYGKAAEAIVDPGFDVARSAPDPDGQRDKNSLRALRGGSWFDFAGYARAAFRLALPPWYQSHTLGLRFVLRSTSQD